MTPEDRASLAEILAEKDEMRCVELICDFYRDADRAQRTPRSFIYLHLGMLSGMVMRLIADTKQVPR